MTDFKTAIQQVVEHHENLSNHGGVGSIDIKSIAFTMGYVAGVQYAAALKRGAASLVELKAQPQSDVLFFDMDDCLYTNDWKVAEVVSKNIRRYCSEVMGLPEDAGYTLYRKYGTTIRGLIHDHIDNFDIEDYMVKAHDIATVQHLIQPDPELRDMLERSRVPVWVFTASTMAHAHNCLGRLDLLDIFEDRILACTSHEMGFGTKYEAASFDMARTAAGPQGLGSVTGVGTQTALDPSRCYFADDSPGNIERAKKCGFVLLHFQCLLIAFHVVHVAEGRTHRLV